ncbi:MAG TPA: hypothetical protein DCY26_04770 [Hyphomonas sp.]|nr:hypothetical protein [Hyphomonas sp.]
MKLSPFVCKGFHRVGVHDQVLMHQGSGAIAKALADGAASIGGAADHAIIVSIDDRDLDIGSLADFCAYTVYGCPHAPVRPVGGYVRAPGIFGRFECAAEVALVHGRRFDVVQQTAHILPETECEKRIAFTE